MGVFMVTTSSAGKARSRSRNAKQQCQLQHRHRGRDREKDEKAGKILLKRTRRYPAMMQPVDWLGRGE